VITPASGPGTRAAVYVRISQDRDGTALGVERQRADCERVVSQRGWDLAGVYTDNDISAYNGKVRPEYARLLEDMRAGAVDAVVTWHPDRLHRSPKELIEFIDVVKAGRIAVESVTAGGFDLGTETGRAVAITIGAWAAYESEHKAARQRRKHQELAEKGAPIRGGSRAFGLTADWKTLIPEEVALIRDAADKILAGSSIRSICVDWNNRGIETTTGGRWQPHPLRRLLTSGRLAGLREYVGTEKRGSHDQPVVSQGTWPAILDVETLERLRVILRDPSRRTTTSRARRYLLTGFLTCHSCGRAMVARPRADKVRRYVCASGPMFGGCGKTYILAEPAEQLISMMVVEAIDSPRLTSAVLGATGQGRDAVAVGAIRADEAALEDLARDRYVERVISHSEFLAARQDLEGRIAANRRTLASTARSAALASVAGKANDLWPDLDFDRRRSVIGAMVDRVVVGPGRRGFNHFDGSRLEVGWRA
jgi:site-specific DNA recombinase